MPTLLCGSETRANKLKSRVTYLEYEISEKIRRKNGKDRLKNITIRMSFKVGSVLEEIDQINLKLYGHLITMNNPIN